MFCAYQLIIKELYIISINKKFLSKGSCIQKLLITNYHLAPAATAGIFSNIYYLYLEKNFHKDETFLGNFRLYTESQNR